MVAFLPGDVEDLSESVFEAALATILGINISAWIFSSQTGLADASYQDLVIVTLNTILAAPVLVSLLNMYDDGGPQNTPLPGNTIYSTLRNTSHISTKDPAGGNGTTTTNAVLETVANPETVGVAADGECVCCKEQSRGCSCQCVSNRMERKGKKRFIVYYFGFAVTVSSSTLFHLIIFLSRSLGTANNNRTFPQVCQELWGSCKGFVITSILLTTVSLVQIIALGAPAAMIVWLWFTSSAFPVRDGIQPAVKRKRLVGVAVYFGSIAAIVLIEVLTQDLISVVWDDGGLPWGFGQILAMVLLVAPLLALFDYGLNPSPKLNGSRPASPRYLMWRTLP